MPDILKHSNGELDYAKLFMAFAAAFVLILQQWQSYRIAEIQATAKANQESFMPRKEVNDHIRRVESAYMPKEEIQQLANNISEKLDFIEEKLNGDK